MKTKLSLFLFAFPALLAFQQPVAAQEQAPVNPPEKGEKSAWHGFDRYDFLMDNETLAIKPMKKPADEKNNVKDPPKGQRRGIVVVPRQAAPGNPWSWQACYWDHEPQTEVELLKRGFHIAFITPDGGVEARDKAWDAWYQYLTEKHGLAKRAAFVGMSKGGVNEYSWGGVNPEKVACIYADNPALWDEDFAKLSALARHDVPLLHVCGSEDFLVDRYTRVVEDMYHTLGGQITVIIKDGHAHHRHSLQNAQPIADWIERHMTPSTANKPAFVDATYTKAYYYSLEPKFIYLKEENSYATARGPGYAECYDRYNSPTSGKFKTGGFSIIVPRKVAPGKPWVFTGDALERDATVEQALLAKGYHILVVSPLGSGFTSKQWNDAYKLLVDNGFSTRPVLKGIGPKAGEAYAWAVANPDKVSCIYARNPLMKSLMAGKEQPINNLAALAKAGVPVLHDCGALDPWLDSQTRAVEKRYQELGGKITVIVREGEGHFPLSPKDPKSVVDFMVSVEPKSAPADKAAPQPDAPQQGPAKSGTPAFDKNSPFFFDGAISRQSLENYLDRAITMGYFLVPGQPERYQFPYRDDDVRMIHNTGAKFIGRAIYRWSEESKLGDSAFLEHAKKLVERVHSADPEVIFQGCLFENVSADVNNLKIPAWVFVDFGLPAEDRTFSRAEIIKRSGKGGGRGGVPIINNLETRLWFYYLAASYINIGCEALHLGQVGLIGADDRDLQVYAEFLAKVRSYAKQHARRHLVLLDGHVPSGGMVKDGVSLLDFNSFPMRIKAVAGKPHVPGKPQEAILEVGHLDSLFKRSKACISPSGWKCDSLPYLVEFDNFGRGPKPNVADPKSMFCWGWDEISWFAQQPEEYRNQWLHYAHDWIKRTDPNGHLQMPGARMITCPNETLRSYFANTKSSSCPVGYSQEEAIKEIWVKNATRGAAQQGKAPDGVELLRDVVVGTGSGRAMHADIARPRTLPVGLMPAVIWIHGGGWTSGSHHEFQQTIQLARHGYLVLSVEYRFPKEAMWPAQIEDCKLAVRWLRANAAKYQVDPDRIGCWGTSAGGHLAALMGVTSNRPELEGKGGSEGFSSTVRAVVNFCGPTRFTGTAYIAPTKAMAGGTYEEKTDIYKQMSPLEYINPKAPPFLFVNGEKDTTVPLFHAEHMVEALKKVNVPAALIVVKNAGHGYVFNGSKDAPADPSPAEVDAAVLTFLDANLQKNASKRAAQPDSTAIPVKGGAPISLYGAGAASRDDGVKKQAGDSFRWIGSGPITWKVQVDRAGDYEVALNHAAEPGAVGQQLQISSGNSKVEYKLAMTKGVFGSIV